VRAALSIAEGDDVTGETLLADALAMAARHGALAWQLRAATDLAKLRVAHGRRTVRRSRLTAPSYEGMGDTIVQSTAAWACGLMA